MEACTKLGNIIVKYHNI